MPTEWIADSGSAYQLISQYARLGFGGMLLFVIAYQVWAARAHTSEPILYLTAAWAGASLLMVVGRSVQHATLDPSLVLLGAKLFHTGAFALVPLGCALTHEMRGVPRDRLFWAMAVGSSLPIPLVWVGHLIISDRVQTFQTLVGPIVGPAPTTLGPAAIPYLLVISAYLIYLARRGQRTLSWDQRLSVNLFFVALLPALFNDVLLYSGAVVTVELVNVALFAHIMAVNVGIFSRAGELYADLEQMVETRTAQLLAHQRELEHMLAVRRRMLNAIPDVLCLLDGRRFDYVNDAGEEFFGRSKTDLVGVPLTMFVAPGQHDEAERCLAVIDASPMPTPLARLRFATAGGRERRAEVSGLRMDLGDGPRTLLTIRDVTAHQQLLSKLQVADRLATVGTLAAGVAHEINNPLTFIGGNLELLKDALAHHPEVSGPHQTPQQVRQSVDDCVTGTARIAQIVSDLAAFTRPSDAHAGVDCRAALEYVLKIAKATIRHAADVTVVYGDTPLAVGDTRRLSQVFLNLLVNALHSLPDDGSRHTIHVSTSTRTDGWVVTEIADTGSGIPPDMANAVFDPFVTTKPVGKGTGLGLFICHGIVTDLGGTIELVPNMPVGTIARVALPPQKAPGADRTTGGVPTKERSRPAVRVLVADDDELVRRVLIQQLPACDVTSVGDGREAILALERQDFDVILCDLMMPGCNGDEVLEKARQLHVANRFVLMTGGATTAAMREFVERPGVRCLAKPITRIDLEAAIGECLAAGGDSRRSS